MALYTVLENPFLTTEGRLMNAQNAGERNICRFDGERRTETEFFFLRLPCADRMYLASYLGFP
jgi:hypothetical protein